MTPEQRDQYLSLPDGMRDPRIQFDRAWWLHDPTIDADKDTVVQISELTAEALACWTMLTGLAHAYKFPRIAKYHTPRVEFGVTIGARERKGDSLFSAALATCLAVAGEQA